MNASSRTVKPRTFAIAAPFTTPEMIAGLAEAGADELYCGLVDRELERRWPSALHSGNRRGKGKSFESFAAFREAVMEAARRNLPVYVTMNVHYTPDQLPWALKTIDRVTALDGVAGVIVADMGLLLKLRESSYRKNICVSTLGTTFNAETFNFYGELGARRVVLDRQLTAAEIRTILEKRDPSVGAEIFIFGNGCVFIDGYCRFMHCKEKGKSKRLGKDLYLTTTHNIHLSQGCRDIRTSMRDREFDVFDASGRKMKKDAFVYRDELYPAACNLCAMIDLKELPGVTLKVIGRGRDRAPLVKLIAGFRDLLLAGGKTRDFYRAAARETFYRHEHEACTGFKCFCPEKLV